MTRTQRLSREQQIALLADAEKRLDSHVQKWIQKPEVKAMLHRFDRKALGIQKRA